MDLVVGASESTVKSLLGKLGSLLAQEYTLISGVRGDIQYINDELASMQAFLRDITATPDGQDNRMKDWMKQVRDMAYDVEDCIDEAGHRIHGPRSDICCASVVIPVHDVLTWWPRRQIATQIADLKSRAQQIALRRKRYGVDNFKNDKNTSPAGSGPTAGFNVADHQEAIPRLIGLQEPVAMGEAVEKLGRWVTDDSKSGGVLSIVGFGGLGKTTIAMELYRKYSDKFDRRAMVTLSQISDVEAVLESILDQVKPQDQNEDEQQTSSDDSGIFGKKRIISPLLRTIVRRVNWNSNPRNHNETHMDGDNKGAGSLDKELADVRKGLHKQLRDQLTNNSFYGPINDTSSFLLLIDDVWSVTTLENIRGFLPMPPASKTKGRIIVTTRFPAVGHACNRRPEDDIHNVRELSHDQSTELFKKSLHESKTLFGAQTQGFRRNLTRISREAVQTATQSSQISEHDTTVSSTRINRIPGDQLEKLLKEALLAQFGQRDCENIERISQEIVLQAMEHSQNTETIRSREPRSSMAGGDHVPTEIIESCGGLPLAIVTMAGTVACNPSNSEWDGFYNTLVPKDPVKTVTPDIVTKIINYCYNDMPGELRTLSLYLSIFPKGSKVSRKRLTRRWIAEGFVTEKEGLSLEDVAEAYCNYLIKRKIIRPVEHCSNGKVKSFQVHDMVLHYILAKASEENFVNVIGGHWLTPLPSTKVRRLSLHGGDTKRGNVTNKMNLSHVRSLTMFGSMNQLPTHSFKFGIAQVLDLEGCKGFKNHHMNNICKMVLLKYLSLRRIDIKELPEKIGNLKELETLDIRDTNVEVLPSSVCQLERLVNLLGGNKRTRKALNFPKDNKKKTIKGSLRVLSGVAVDGRSAAAADLHHLTDLRKLAIYKLDIRKEDETFRLLSSSIEYLGGYSLHTLVVDDDSSEFLKSLAALSSPPKLLNSLELSGKLVDLPKWIMRLDFLTKLTLSVTALQAENLKQLSELKTLFSLTFSLTAAKLDPQTAAILEDNKAHTGGEILFPAGGFDKLKLLRFFAPVMPSLSFPEMAMPNLQRLELRFSILEGVYGLHNLQKNLEEVHLRMHDEAGEVTRQIVQDMATTAREDSKSPRIIVDLYHE
uniref:AAA+ ATPase domain-containing protein n=1 Tax=Leersia perrieri TaxID=77586 RepID=A0A0D9XJ41_9ORYZ